MSVEWLARRVTQRAAACFFLLLAAFWLSGAAARAELANADCLKCHGDPSLAGKSPAALAALVRTPAGQSPAPRTPAEIRKLFISRDAFQHSAHAGQGCTSCHQGIDSLPHNPRLGGVSCADCHAEEERALAASVHRPAAAAAAARSRCLECHGDPHKIDAIAPPGTSHTLPRNGRIEAACARCHIRAGETYLQSYHGKAAALGGGSAAVCSSCHGGHDILPTSNSRSRVAPANLPATCGRCHKNANANFVRYLPHVDEKDPKSSLPVFIVWALMNALLLGTLAVFIPHGLLWFQRSLAGRFRRPRGYHLRPPGERRIERFRPIHRLTHALIVISFMGLVATGFPLKYSQAGWARALASALGGARAMGIIHRALALVTLLYAAAHAGFLVYFFAFKCPRPRRKWLLGPDSLLFSWRDLRDFIAMARWFFRLGPRPRFDRWAYFEKFDYWGEIWGVFVIGGTGLMLWLPTLFTRWLPGWVLNCATVIHSIEALLAASVVFLVHFFNTHLRPEKFPIDMAMLTGQMAESEMREERPAEYGRLLAEGKLRERTAEPVAFKWRVLGGAAGILAFLCGIVLIALAFKTEIGQIFR